MTPRLPKRRRPPRNRRKAPGRTTGWRSAWRICWLSQSCSAAWAGPQRPGVPRARSRRAGTLESRVCLSHARRAAGGAGTAGNLRPIRGALPHARAPANLPAADGPGECGSDRHGRGDHRGGAGEIRRDCLSRRGAVAADAHCGSDAGGSDRLQLLHRAVHGAAAVASCIDHAVRSQPDFHRLGTSPPGDDVARRRCGRFRLWRGLPLGVPGGRLRIA
jgi:hypothetical protein